MANATTDLGHGATLVLGTSGTALDWKSLDLGEESIETVDTSHLLTPTHETVIGADLISTAPWVCEGNWDSENSPVVSNIPELATVTYPLPPGSATAATYVASVIITNVKQPVMVSGELQMGTVTLKPDGVGTVSTFTAGTTV